MANREPNDLQMPGYFLPEAGQFRLKKLRDHMVFLSHLAQPRTFDEDSEYAPGIRLDELAVCLELLAEQAELVLAEVTWPAFRGEDGDAPGSGSGPSQEAADEAAAATDAPAGPPPGITLDQIDELNRLIQTISALGDAVAASGSTELADATLPALGETIFDSAQAVRDILDRIEAQRAAPATPPQGRVREERAVYQARLTCCSS
ncbi:XAC0095 family protein [Coralloluteibacterium stylophorae]|uniref:XAC0095-like domain-containing protein n=1 Tax=Coralloluteibacterium stylophorae TaxID=1776034 RepID=A0A8J7VRD0_9GAMM|nr:hypothetical protein [Coralloluteibacterium stylophorae]MBS7456646.1 hypothetical protein [Coralloluteibacterium stylophorae]